MVLYFGVPPMRLPTDDATTKLFKWELFNNAYIVRLDLLQYEISEYQIIVPPYLLHTSRSPDVQLRKLSLKEKNSVHMYFIFTCMTKWKKNNISVNLDFLYYVLHIFLW
jgi:hypothetical protein